MQVTADVIGEGERDLDLAADATYADLLRACSLSPHEATVLVDGSPVPADAPVAADTVAVLRLVTGGAPVGASSGSAREGHAPRSFKPIERLPIPMRRAGDGHDDRRGSRRAADGGDRPSDADPPAGVSVGPAREGERATALGIIDMAGLQVDREAVMAGDREVLVAVADGRVLGALVLDGEYIEAVAVRPGRQGRGIGSALVAGAWARRERLIAEFDANLRDFYANLGFDIESVGESRYRGVLA